MSYGGTISYLRENLESTLTDFQKKRRDNRYKAFRFKVLATLFSALATILLGLGGLTEPATVVTKNIALGLSAFVTVLSA